ncbi:hypothetical protein D9757_010885 [Collybiopsis confluens]|uniref:CCHC-type domain-containing protein n=1 Tax=Collybiopsis confluens TaxID=2823264 RepID=A0A8H5M2N8_9AGAR|nr:hypothetical protein D9757_010885 [Collybiopsis confluens]
MYQPKGAIGIVSVRRKLFRTQCQEGEDINEHIRTMTRYRKELAALSSQLSEDEFSITLLTSLPDSWDSFIQGVDTASLSDSTKLISRVLEQARRKVAKPSSDDIALAANRFKSKGSKPSSTATCHGCGCPGHFISDCHDTAAGKTYTEQQKKENYRRTMQNRSRPNNKSNRAHIAQEELPTETDYAFMSQDSRNSSLPADTWLIDSACTKHIVRNKTFFSTYSETPGHSVKGFGQTPAMGQGIATIATHLGKNAYNIALRNTLHVPDAPFNLISVGCMTRAGFTVKFAAESLSIFAPGPSPHKVIRGRRVGNLYVIKVTKSSPRFSSSYSLHHLIPLSPIHLHFHQPPLAEHGKNGTGCLAT